MTFPFTINGHTYTLDDFSPYSYTTGLPAVFADLAVVVPAVQAVATNLTVRQRLTTHTTLYWRAAGTGSGFTATTNNDASAFPSAQAALDWACDNIDQNGYVLTLKAGNASAAWTSGIVTNKMPVGCPGASAFILDWNGGTLTLTGGFACVDLGAAFGWGGVDLAMTIQNVTLSTVTSGSLIAMRGGILQFGPGVILGTSADNHGFLGHGAQLFTGSNLTVSGNAASYHWFCYDGARLVEESSTITFSASVSFLAYLILNSGSRALMGNITYVNKGNATGARFYVLEGSTCDTGGDTSSTYLAGTTDGLCDETSNYAGIQGFPGWQSYSPVPIAQSGTMTTVTGTGRYRIRGKSLELQVRVQITAHGTGSGILLVPLPSGIQAASFIAQALSGFSGYQGVSAAIVASGTSFSATLYSAGTLIADGADIVFGGVIEIV